jgi:hypothetical protein
MALSFNACSNIGGHTSVHLKDWSDMFAMGGKTSVDFGMGMSCWS